jgi:hypothetical protein
MADGAPIRYCGAYGEEPRLDIELTWDDLDAIVHIHETMAGESDAAISKAVQTFLVRVSHPEMLN